MNKKVLLIVLSALLIGGCTVKTLSLKQKEVQARIEYDLSKMFENQEPITQSITLWDAIARALKYNIEHRVQLMEIALAERLLDVSNYTMLPDLLLAAGYNKRDSNSGGLYQSLLTGQETLEPSTTERRGYSTVSLNMVLNVLDFGVSQAIAEQKGNEVLIARERRRGIIQNIVKEVQEAYWYAVAAQRLLPPLQAMLKNIQSALRRYKRVEAQNIQNLETALYYQKRLLETARKLVKLSEKLSLAKTLLATLINLPPGTPYEVEIPPKYELPDLQTPLEELESKALFNQPALREADYLKRIGKLEVKKAIRRMFPGLSITIGGNYSSNKFLYHQSRVNAGLQVSWNLLHIFTTGQAAKKAAQAQVILAEHRRMALSMAILTQLWISYQRYQLALENFNLSQELYIVNNKLARLANQSPSNQIQDELEMMFAHANTLISQINQDLAYAQLHATLANIHQIIGLDPLPGTLTTHEKLTLNRKYLPPPQKRTVIKDISTLAREIETHLKTHRAKSRRRQYASEY